MKGPRATAITLLAACYLCGTGRAGPLAVRAGIGYEFLSQQYFLDSAVFFGPDSVLANWELTTDYLDDVKAQLALEYSPRIDRRIELKSSYEQTAELMRLRMAGALKPVLGKIKLDLNGELERRDRYRQVSEFGDAYLSGYFRGRITKPLTGSVTAGLQLHGDGVTFDSPSEFSFNFYRLGGKILIAKSYQDFSFADARLFLTARRVPDSSVLDYVNFGLEGSLLGFYEGVELDLYSRVERKDYNQPFGKDDHLRFEFDGRNKVVLGGFWYSRQILELDLVSYSSDDPVNTGYGRAGFALLCGHENDGFSLAAGPDFEYLNEEQSDLTPAEDYFDSGARIDVDYMAQDVFCSVESILGLRRLRHESDLQTGFTFERLNVIADIRILTVLHLSVLFSAEWEWHARRQENSELYLLSSNLSYAF